jgi:hypothetical protein
VWRSGDKGRRHVVPWSTGQRVMADIHFLELPPPLTLAPQKSSPRQLYSLSYQIPCKKGDQDLDCPAFIVTLLELHRKSYGPQFRDLENVNAAYDYHEVRELLEVQAFVGKIDGTNSTLKASLQGRTETYNDCDTTRLCAPW